jgi:hypothetical protein
MEINEASGDDRPDPDIAEQAVPAARLPVGRVIREGYQLVGSHFVSAAMLTVVIGFLFYSLRTYLSDHASISGSILRTLALDIAFNTVVAVVLALVTTRWLRQFILGERERLRLPGLRELRGIVAVLVVLLAIDGSLPLEMRLAATVAPWLKPLAGLPWILLILVFDLFRISVLAVLLMLIVPAISVDAPRPVARVFAAASRDFGRLVGVLVIGLVPLVATKHLVPFFLAEIYLSRRDEIPPEVVELQRVFLLEDILYAGLLVCGFALAAAAYRALDQAEARRRTEVFD